MNKQLRGFLTATFLIPVLLASAAHAQTEVKVDAKPPAGQQGGTVTIETKPAPTTKVANPGVEFSKLGGEVARPAIKIPAGAKSIQQVSAPLGTSGEQSVLVHVYQRNQAVFFDIFTAKGQQPWTRRNTVRLLAPLPDDPQNLQLSLRYLEPRKKKGLLIVASDDAMHYTLAFPKGLGANVTQQQFLTTGKTGAKSTFTFDELDGRGYAIVKATVLSSGEIKPGDDLKYFVWNGTRFIPRAYN